jgi:AraC-like DNA-binding protein
MTTTHLYHPNPALASFVAYYLVVTGAMDGPVRHTLSAKGAAALMFPFKAPSDTYMYDFNGSCLPKKILDEPALVGPSSTHSKVFMSGELNFVVVVLQSTGVYHFLKETVRSTTNYVNTFDNFGLFKPFSDLQDRLWEVHQPADAIHLIEQALYIYFNAHNRTFFANDFTHITQYVLGKEGMLSVGDLRKKFNCSERYLENHFACQTGLSPKSFIRIARFRALMCYALSHSGVSWMNLVAQFNYTDQSHLIKDFYHYTGDSPARYFPKFSAIEHLLKQDTVDMGGRLLLQK